MIMNIFLILLLIIAIWLIFNCYICKDAEKSFGNLLKFRRIILLWIAMFSCGLIFAFTVVLFYSDWNIVVSEENVLLSVIVPIFTAFFIGLLGVKLFDVLMDYFTSIENLQPVIHIYEYEDDNSLNGTALIIENCSQYPMFNVSVNSAFQFNILHSMDKQKIVFCDNPSCNDKSKISNTPCFDVKNVEDIRIEYDDVNYLRMVQVFQKNADLNFYYRIKINYLGR